MEKRVPQGDGIMDKKQRLMKLYEAEIQKISEIREDMDSLAEMSDDQLIVLVEKAGKCSRAGAGSR